MCTSSTIGQYGAAPATMQWTVVRGDTSPLSIQFLENDEVTFVDTTDWEVKATSYDPNGEILDDLGATVSNGIINIDVPSSITENWGTTYKSVVAELQFDVQVTIPSDGDCITWTPLIGTIRVLGDISPGGSL